MLPGRAREIARFTVTGALCVAFNVLVVLFLTESLGLHYLLSIIICFVLVTLLGFALNRGWTFGRRGPTLRQDFARYVIVTLTQVLASLAGCAVCVELFRIPYPLAVVLVAGLLAPATYLSHRLWSFGL